jgi:phosphoglycerate dehydrogenase-like enzyme
MRERVVITSPIEPNEAQYIRDRLPAGVELVYEPDLLPRPRFSADHKGSPSFKRADAEEARWQELLSSATILWDFPDSALGWRPTMDLCADVGWIQATSSGVVTMIERSGLNERDVIVTTARGVHAGPLAEFVMMGCLMHVKDVDHLRSEQAAHRWDRFCSKDLPGSTMLIVGAGRIGTEVGRLAKAFGMRVLSVARNPDPSRAAEANADAVFGIDRLGDAVAQADFIVLCLPHTAETDKLFDAAMLDRIAPHALFINIARGGVVDEPALVERLRDGRIARALLDVAQTEPLPADSPLWDMPNVLISPHSASTVARENLRIADIFLNNLSHYLNGEPEKMENVFDRARGY